MKGPSSLHDCVMSTLSTTIALQANSTGAGCNWGPNSKSKVQSWGGEVQ
jgi:hypothetical protein